MPKSLTYVLAIALALGATECFLRCLRPRPLFYSTWFTSHIHETDAALGFRFVSKYRGQMRHDDGAYSVPLNLDDQGFRIPHGDIDPERSIVIVGGASMPFCYGLRDDQTIAAVISKRTETADVVQTISWPGFDLARDVLKLQRWTAIHGKPDIIIVCANKLQDVSQLLTEGVDKDFESVEMTDGIVIPNESATAEMVGDAFYRSYALAGLVRHAEYLRIKARRLGSNDDQTRKTQIDGEPEKVASQDQKSLLDRLRSQVAQPDRESSILIVLLPAMNSTLDSGDASTIPNHSNQEVGASVLDLRDSLDSPFKADWIASGHYGPRSAKQVGKLIAERLDAVHRTENHPPSK